eukprot:gnl/TRDRNA2_/TRDRNA2_143386_c1_seq1.p1 gnl/TRDRNA2_/TRDRNA2_143386_c1~~gnl/TRDRNA2_/TRDRNA2_143386_c1_seq1.p1  ORF type:complete len:726 (-),score=133.46 gnl/TRDRNA2_/TRDRNA2_143386_c1_seq1:60-2237(-)
MLMERARPDVLLEVPSDGSEVKLIVQGDKELQQLIKCTAADRAWLSAALTELEAASPDGCTRKRRGSGTVTAANLEAMFWAALPASVTGNAIAPARSSAVAGAEAEENGSSSAVEGGCSGPGSAAPSSIRLQIDGEGDTAEGEEGGAEEENGDCDPEEAAADTRSRGGSALDELERRFGRPAASVAAEADPIDWLLGNSPVPTDALKPAESNSERCSAVVPSQQPPQPVAAAASCDQEQDMLRLEAEWAAVVDTSRATFWAYFIKLLSRTAYVAGPGRDLVAGLESAPRDVRGVLAKFGLPWLTRWTTQTQGGRTWLQAHRLPVYERRAPPPREGQGVYKFANGDEYRGEFRRSVRHGEGVYTSAKSGVHYDGQWRDDKRAGSGILTVESSVGSKILYTYDGEWLEDRRHGQGSCVRRGKEKYSGQWANNAYHGNGTLVDADGAVFEGEWVHGQFTGVGKHIHSGETYTGEFRDGARHGMGQLVHANGSTPPNENSGLAVLLGSESLFAGQWNDGARCGTGRAIYERGEYDGEWVRNARHGHGVLAHEGFQLEGPWTQGEPDESGVHMLFYPGGSKYTGYMRRRTASDGAPAGTEVSIPDPAWWFVPEGKGLVKLSDGSFYEGSCTAAAWLARLRGLEVPVSESVETTAKTGAAPASGGYAASPSPAAHAPASGGYTASPSAADAAAAAAGALAAGTGVERVRAARAAAAAALAAEEAAPGPLNA